MNKNLFTAIEVALIAGLILVVLYWGGVFEPKPAPSPTAFPLPTIAIRTPTPEPTTTPKQTPHLTRTPRPTILPSLAPTNPAVIQPSGLILFETTRDGNTEIYTVDVVSGVETNLTHNPADDFGAAWSPDGTRIAFFSIRSGWLEVFTMNADGSNITQRTRTERTNTTYYGNLAWSGDGYFLLAFRHSIWISPASHINPQFLEVIPTDGVGARLLYSNEEQTLWNQSWSPDNRHAAASISGSDQPCRIHIADVESTPIEFKPIAPTCNIFDWSPDGTQIAFPLDGSIYIYALDGTQVQRIEDVPNPCDCGVFKWSPDGQHFLYLGANAMVGVVSLTGTRRIILPVQIHHDKGWPDWSPDGQWVTF